MIAIETKGLDTILVELKDVPPRITRALVRALNRGMTSGRAVMVKAVAADTGLKQADIRKAIPITEANASRVRAQIAASPKLIPLIAFGARGPEPSRGKGRGVTAKLGQGRNRYPHAFIATMRSGHRGVYERRSKKRLQIDELFGPSIGRVFQKYRQPTIAAAIESFEKNLDHELTRAGNG